MKELPSSWVIAAVGEVVVSLDYGTSAKTSETPDGVPVLRMGNLVDGALVLDDLKYLPASHYEFPKLLLHRGDLLFNRTNSPALVGKTAVFGGTPHPCSFASYLIRARLVHGVQPEYLSWLLTSTLGRKWVSEVVTQQVGQANVNGSKLRAFRFPLPPSFEQRRIVDEIDKQFTRLDAAVAGLQRIKANLKRYRASVLKAACEGRLVPTEAELARREGRSFESGEELLKRILKERRARWEADQLAKMKAAGKTQRDDGWKAKYSQPAGPVSRSAATLPVGWVVATLDELSEKLTSGSRDWSQFYGKGRGTFVLAQNIRPGRLDLSFRQAVDAPASDPSTERSRIRVGDLLLTIVGANTGDVCGVHQEVRDHFVCQSVALVRPVLVETSTFVEWFLVSQEHGQKQFRSFTYGQGRPHLGFEQIAATLTTVPPLPEQHRIVAEVERRLSVVDELEATVEKNLARCARLRQSILKTAFEGRLVPQDPNDEPASVLLERIRRGRDSAEVADVPPRLRKAAKR